MTRVKIVSSGTPGLTRVFLAETGQEIQVRSIKWELDWTESRLTLVLLNPIVELESGCEVEIESLKVNGPVIERIRGAA